jgi:hypothetical protein
VIVENGAGAFYIRRCRPIAITTRELMCVRFEFGHIISGLEDAGEAPRTQGESQAMPDAADVIARPSRAGRRSTSPCARVACLGFFGTVIDRRTAACLER